MFSRTQGVQQNGLQYIFGDVFYTKPALQIPTKSLVTSKLSGKSEIKFKLQKQGLELSSLKFLKMMLLKQLLLLENLDLVKYLRFHKKIWMFQNCKNLSKCLM